MKRHLLAGYLGPSDKIIIPKAADEQLTKLELTTGRFLNYGINGALADLNKLEVYPSEVGLDLLIVAAHVHAADTRISRDEQSQDSWTREIRLVVPVSDPALWKAAARTLTQTLNFLTGDRWTVGFRSRPKKFSQIAPRPSTLFAPPFDEVSLFSGGLDSLIGAIDQLESGRTPLLISHAGEGATSDAQYSLFDKLKGQYSGSAFDRLRLWMTFPKGLVKGVGPESSTRARSFLFFAIGVFACSGLGGDSILRVPENGLIALNVPLDPLRLGSNSTRTTHPFYMSRWNDLVRELGLSIRIENPYWDKTKGEMVSACLNEPFLKTIITDSLSCSSPTKGRWEGHGIEHCGYCLPCLIRRAAIEMAWGPDNDPTVYTLSDLKLGPLDTNKSFGKQVRSLQVAFERIRRHPEMVKLLIHKPGPLTDVSHQLDQLSDVYFRGINEVADLINGVTTKPI